MKKSTLLFLLIPFGFSCTSSYKSLQTPDDVYYSPAFLRTDSIRHDRTSEDNRSVYNTGPTVIYRNYPSNRIDNDDYYYYNHRRHSYYPPDVYVTTPTTVSKARTTNLRAFGKHKDPVYVNPKVLHSTSAVAPASTSNVSTFKIFSRPRGTVVGNAVRSIVRGNVFNTSSRNSTSVSTSSSGKSSSGSSSSGKGSSKSSGHR